MVRGPGVSRHFEVEGARLHTIDWAGSNPPIVLLHPNRTNARVWDFVVAHSTLPNRFVSIDHRGHGCSEWPARGYELDDYLADDVAVIEQLDAGPVILAGAATGGNIALLIASSRPELVCGLAVLDPGLSLDPEINAEVQRQIEHGYSFPTFAAAVEAMPFSDLWTEAMRDFYAAHAFGQRDDGTWAGRYLQAAAKETEALLEEDMWDRIRVSCPTLAVRGDRSAVFDREKLVRLAGLIDDCVLAEIPRANHRVMQDNPAVVAALLDGFVRKVMTA
jgi:pimeloyl-ACP methyl ester carboxylesterase